MKKVAIIGAGFTGLTAAYELAKKGIDVTVFEKGSDLGGLAGGFTLEGTSLEKAYHHLFRTDTDILGLFDELGMGEEVGWFESKVGNILKIEELKIEGLKIEGLNVEYLKLEELKTKGVKVEELKKTESLKLEELKKIEEAKVLEFQILPFNGVKDLLQYRPLPFLDRIRGGLVVFFLQKYKNWRALAQQTAMQWMTKWSGSNFMNAIWGPLLKGKFSIYASKVSMAWLWARIHIRANSRNSPFEKELLAYPKRGFVSLAEKLAVKTAELLQKPMKEVVRLDSSIEKITFKKGQPVLTVNGSEIVFDAMLSTIPQQSLQKLLDPQMTIPKNPTEKQIDYLGAVVLAFSSSQSLSSYYWHNVMTPDSPFLVFLQHTNLVPSTWYNDKQVYYIGVYVPLEHRYLTDPICTDETIAHEWFAYLKKLFPTFDQTLISEKKLFRFPYAQHVVDTNYEQKIAPYQSALPNTFVANFAQIFPEDRGTNYAVREGKKIAHLIEANLLQYSS